MVSTSIRLAPPIGMIERGERGAILLVERGEAALPRSRLSHSAKFGAGDSVTKVEMRGISRETSSTTCLMRK